MAALASAPIGLSYSIKVPVHTHSKVNAPPVAARLRARDFPARSPTTPQKTARVELIVASEKARKSAIAAAHNARVNDAVNNATLMKSQINDYVRITTDRRLLEAEVSRTQQLTERADKAKMYVQRVDTVAEKLQSRKAYLTSQTARKLEAAKQLRQRKIAGIQFKAADATARAKSIAVVAAKDAATKAMRIKGKVETAVQRRDRFLFFVASKAAFYNARHERGVAHVRANLFLDARTTVVKLESKMAAAEYLRTLDLRLRQSKAALTNERAANVVERQRLTSHVSPMIGAARIRAGQYMASERRNDALTDIANRAHGFVRKAVLTCAVAEVRAKEQTDTLRANLEDRLAAAAERKGDLLACHANVMAGGGPSPDRTMAAAVARPQSARGAFRRPSESTGSTGGTVFRPPSPGSPFYSPRRAVARSSSSRSEMKGLRHSIAGVDGSFSMPTSPIGA